MPGLVNFSVAVGSGILFALGRIFFSGSQIICFYLERLGCGKLLFDSERTQSQGALMSTGKPVLNSKPDLLLFRFYLQVGYPLSGLDAFGYTFLYKRDKQK
jgi:hypothetical protein